ncbi:MAG TPA: nuclear transport factor 2 family protein [Gammaproteobacteria bacterium]|nr:nuclear transport factor 2 family protein [Gammaproteobacteria bacterium]
MRSIWTALLGGAALAGLAGPAAAGYGDDRAEIENLQARYVLAMDFHDPDAYAATFTEDGVLDWARGQIVGRKAIREFLASGAYNPTRGAKEVEGWPAAYRHFILNQVIKVDGDHATAVTYWFQGGNLQDRGKFEFGLFGTYEDELEKVDGHWLFKKRAIYNEGLQNRHRAGMPNPDPVLEGARQSKQ